MKRITITIDTTNDAFAGDAFAETARVLRDIADHVEQVASIDKSYVPVRDANGNTCGKVTIK